MKRRLTKWRLWWGWQPEALEHWLENQEQQGYNLVGADWAAMRFQFIAGQPRLVRYCVDYQDEADESYIALFEDDSWKLAYRGLNWYIWGKVYEKERPEIYTELKSLMDRNKRLLDFGYVFLGIIFVIFFSLLLRLINGGLFIWEYAIMTFVCFNIGLMTYGLKRIHGVNKDLSVSYRRQGRKK